MIEREPTCIGRVRHVLGATVTVELDAQLAGVSPMWHGRLVPIAQVGSLVRIPQGSGYVLGWVSLVGISELAAPLAPAQAPTQGDRWLQIQLLGEVDALGVFHRGVSSYPGLDDSVHFTTMDELNAVYPQADKNRVLIGTLAAAPGVPVTLDAAKLVTRHSAIVGSTGSGKTSAVSSLLQSLIAGGWQSANVVVIDPHGEYSTAMPNEASIRTVLGGRAERLTVPFWALPAGDLLRVLTGLDSRTISDKWAELVRGARRNFADEASWLNLNLDEITADTPVPFDIRKVWYDFDYANRVTVTSKTDDGEDCVESSGDPSTLTAARFTPYGPTKDEPVKGSTHGFYAPAPERLKARLQDERFEFFLSQPDPGQPDPLVRQAQEWLGGDKPISVLDFSGVPGDVADLAIGVVLNLIYELAVRSDDKGIGRNRPVLFVLEEAHRYLSSESNVALARDAVNRIAREGRKYGLGLMLVTQRPSELPDTALSQCGTIMALRLTNGTDQATVRAALPDAVSGLSSALPSLRTGEAVISGESVVVPTRTVLRVPNPAPRAADATLRGWRVQPSEQNDLSSAVEAWRSRA